MANTPADFDRKQFLRDLLFTQNRYHLNDRFVIRDGKRHPFAVICPGGAYWMVCSYIEGVPVAKKLNELGISAFIVNYRVRKKAHYPAPQEDLATQNHQAVQHEPRRRLSGLKKNIVTTQYSV